MTIERYDATSGSGVLSAPFDRLPTEQRQRSVTALLELPDDIALLSLRRLGPTIGHPRRHHRLNALGMEVLAAAEVLGAEVFLSAAAPRLQTALTEQGQRCSML